MKLERAETINERVHSLADVVGKLLVDVFHYLALFAICGSIVWSAVHAFIGMAVNGQAGIGDILLLFIYLELGAMVGIYFKTNHMPVRFLIYVAITALVRLLIGDIQAHHRLDHALTERGREDLDADRRGAEAAGLDGDDDLRHGRGRQRDELITRGEGQLRSCCAHDDVE